MVYTDIGIIATIFVMTIDITITTAADILTDMEEVGNGNVVQRKT